MNRVTFYALDHKHFQHDMITIGKLHLTLTNVDNVHNDILITSR